MAASFKNLNGDHLEDEDVRSKSLKSRKPRQPRDPHSISQRYPPGINREFPGVLPTENHIPVDPRHQQYSHADGMTGSQPLPQRGRNQFTGIPSQYQPGMANYVPDRPDIFPPGVNRGPYPLYQAPLIQEPRPMNYSTSEQVQYLASQVQEILLEIREIKGFAGLISEINFKVEQVLDQNNELKDVLDDIQFDVAAMKGRTVLSDHIQEDRSFDEHTTVPEITQQVPEPHNKIKDEHISPPLTRINTEATPEMDSPNHADARNNLNTSPTLNEVLKDNENKKPFVNERVQNTTRVDKEPVIRHDKEQVIRLDKEPVIRVDKEPVIINKKNSVETPEIINPMKPADTERHFSLVPKNIPQEPVNNIVRSNVDIGTEISMTGRQYKSKKTEQTDDNRISYFNSQSEEDDSDEEIPIAKINPLPPRSPSPEEPTMARPITDDEEELPQIKEDQYLEQLALSENFRARDCLDPKSSGADTVICIDTSDSMAGEPYEKCIDFVSRFIDNIEEWATEYSIEENIAIVHFGKEAKILQQLTNDYNKVREAVETLSIGGPTPMMTGLVVAMSALFNRGGPVTVHNRQINPRVILLSDGHATDHRIFDGRDILQPNGLSGEMIKDKLEDFAERVKLENRYIISIPVGDNPNLEILKPLAETTGGFVSSLDKVKSLSRAFFVEVMISQTRYEGITDEIKTNRQEIAAIARSLQNGKDLTEEEMNEVVTRVIQETEEQIEIEKLREIQRNEIDEESEMEVGLRVRRGKDWIWGDQDGFGTGTVIGHRSRGYVRVKWDCGNVGRYRHGAQNSYDLIVVDEPRILPDDVLIAEGVYVIKGKDWEWDEQDGGEDSVGCVYHFEDEGIVHVRWENGIRGNYRFGGFGKIDLQIITPQDYEKIKKRKQQKAERSSGYHDGATGFNIQTDGTVSPNIQTDGPFSPNLQTDDFKPAIGASGYQPHIAANLPEGTGSLGQPEGTVPVDQEIQHIPTETNDKPEPELGVWQYSVNGQWSCYEQSDNERLEKLYKTKKSGTLIININGENCRVNLGKMTQKNTKTNLESEIRRLEKCIVDDLGIIHGDSVELTGNKQTKDTENVKHDDCSLSTMLQTPVMTKSEINFHSAAKDNDIASVKKLLREKVDINCKNNLDRTPLHWAAANGNLDIIEKIVEAGADVEAQDKYGMRPVLWAAWFGHLEAMKFLINSGATPRCSNKQGMGILHCAAQNNHINIMNFIFESLENLKVDETEKSDRTALFLAAEEGHLEAVMRLIDMRCNVTIRDKEGETAVHVAARKGHQVVVKRLLMMADALVDDRDVEGRTALHVAAENGHTEVVDVLLEFNAGADTETIKGMTPFHYAAMNGHEDVVLTLIKNGANIDAQNFQGNTPLHLATLGNYRHIIEILVQSKCNINLQNSRQQTPIHVAVENGFQESVEVLLAGGADLTCREKLGKTPLQLASRGSFVAIVDMIIKAERYYAVAREYLEQELDYVDPHQYLRTPKHPSSCQMKDILWKLATKQLKPGDWKKLAVYWKFTPDHIRCMEHQYTGPNSHREHGYRLLMIWLHGVRKDENVIKLLFEALVAIDRRSLAEHIRGKSETNSPKICMDKMCSMC